MGHPNYWRAGRSWPSGQEIEVEVLDQDDDPMVTTEVKGQKRTHVDPNRIGRESWKQIVADKQLIKQPVGGTVEEALQLQAGLDQTKAELIRTITRAELAETALAERNAGVDRLLAEREKAHESIAELHDVLNAARSESAKLTAERDDLLKQIEQLTAPAAKVPGDPTATTKSQVQGKGQGPGKRGG
jgi:hypothetical protein